MKVKDFLADLLSLGKDWIDEKQTVDRVTHGDPEQAIGNVGVCWMATTRVIQQAIAKDLDLLIVHEPIIWDHHDDIGQCFDRTGAQAKLELLSKHRITVIRIHDLWDRFPEIGIGPSWARTLGFEDFSQHVYEDDCLYFVANLTPAKTLQSIAAQIVEKTAHLGQNAVAVVGDPELKVSRLVLNIGAWGSSADHMLQARDNACAEAAVATEICWWRDASWALDTGFGLIHVQHGVSEMMGMYALYGYVKDRWSSLDIEFISEASPCCYIGHGLAPSM